ncbi:MAG TPA: hypothetical protein VG166_01585 [Caulobacteraceae bacterium]|nr:hypothetical protein [Caulobacteraceae bacterium]
MSFADFDEAREAARKSLALPLGLASPLWLAFGAATTAGVAWWWMTRWTRAVNLEAMAGAAKAQVGAIEAIVEKESEVASDAVEAAAAMLEATAVIEPAPLPSAEVVADDLTALVGVGPKLAAALAERGITSFAQLADWTAEEADAFDAELSLKGRVARDAWIAQAKRLAHA